MSLSEKNPARVQFDRASIDSAIEAAKRLKSDRELYVFATYLGYTIDHRPPPGMQQYVVVHPDGSTETVKPGGKESPKTNPTSKAGAFTTYQGDVVSFGEMVNYGAFGDRGLLVGGTADEALVRPIITKGGVLVGFKDPENVRKTVTKIHEPLPLSVEEAKVIESAENIAKLRAKKNELMQWQRELLKKEGAKTASTLTPPEDVVRFAGLNIDKTSINKITLLTLEDWEKLIESASFGIVFFETGKIPGVDNPSPKEPWQMTRQEAFEAWTKNLELPIEKRVPHPNMFFGVTDKEIGKRAWAWYENAVREGTWFAQTDFQHRWAVEQALAEGKPVPAEVLADYPGLKAAIPRATPEAEPQPYLEKYRKLVEKYPDRIDKHLERAKDEKASLVLGREFGESFDDYLGRHPDVKRRWDELTIAIGEMEQLKLANYPELGKGNPSEERRGTVGNPAYQVGEKLIVTIGGRDIEGWVVNTKTTKDHFIRYIVRIGPDKYYEASYGQLKRAKGGNPMTTEGKHYFCDNTSLHPNNEVIQIKTLQDDPKCPYCGAIMTYGRYWGPLPATQMSEKGGNPMTTEEIDQVASKVAAKVLEEVSPEILDPAGRGMMIHFTEHAIEGNGLVVNEAKARATPCNCFTYNGREYCFSPGVIGMMSSEENPEQLEAFCKVGKTHEVKPGMKRRFESFAGAAEEAHKKIENIPKGERLVPWLTAMGEELEKRSIEV